MSIIEQQAEAEARDRLTRIKVSTVVRDWFVPSFMEGARWVLDHLGADRQITPALRRRITAAAHTATVSRSAVEFEWPECHAKKCQHRHGDPEQAMGLMMHAITEAIDAELHFEATTRPDVAEEGDTPEDTAVLVLATLLHRYNVRDAGTFARAARLMVDAYPALVEALGRESIPQTVGE